MNKNHTKLQRIVLISILTGILFVQEQILTPLPNIQLTIFLIVVYSVVFTLTESILMITVHVLLDNILLGSLNLVTFPFMLIGYLIIPITLKTIFRKIRSPRALALLGILYAFIYSWIFIIPNIWLLKIPFSVYLIQDIPFEILLASSSFLTILWLYEPFKKVIDMYIPQTNKKAQKEPIDNKEEI